MDTMSISSSFRGKLGEKKRQPGQIAIGEEAKWVSKLYTLNHGLKEGFTFTPILEKFNNKTLLKNMAHYKRRKHYKDTKGQRTIERIVDR